MTKQTVHRYTVKTAIRALALAALLSVAIAGQASLVPEAQATGGYTVRQCGVGEFAGAAWGWYNNGSPSFFYGESQCPGEGLAIWSQGGLNYWVGLNGEWRINSPSQWLRINSWSGGGNWWSDGRHLPVMYACNGDACWNTWTVSGNPGGACIYENHPIGGSGNFDNLRIQYLTVSNGVAPCNGRIRAKNFSIGITDNAVTLWSNIAGSLVEPFQAVQWKSGTKTLLASAIHGGGGIRELSYKVCDANGQNCSGWQGEYGLQNCSIGPSGYFDKLDPCPFNQWKEWSVNTASFPDGHRTVYTRAKEASTHPTDSGAYHIYIDNNYPTKPLNITNEGGDGWQQDPSFNVSWENPSQGSASPIAAAYYRVDGGAWTLVNGSNISQLNNIDVGAQGSHYISVWLRDAAGNQYEGQAVQKTLKWDDEAPTEATPDVINGYVNAVELGKEKATWQEVADPPASDIAGYAVSFDQNPDGDPGTEITHEGKGNRETTIPADLPEGVNYIHVRPISGAGIEGPVRSEVIKVDKTAPVVSSSGVPEGWTKGPASVGLVATDNYSGVDPAWPGSGLIYSVDGGSYLASPGTQATVNLYETGAHTIKTYVVDVAGNKSEEVSLPVKIDGIPPALGFKNVKDPQNPAIVRASAVDQHSGFKEGSLYWKVKGGAKWNLMPTSYEASTQELVGDVPDDSIPEDKEVEFLAKGTDNVGNEGSSDLDLNGGKYTQMTPIKFGSYFANGSESGIVFERPYPNLACRKAEAGYRKARTRKSGAAERGQRAKTKKYRKAMRRYKKKMGTLCGYRLGSKGKKKKAGKASTGFDLAGVAAKKMGKKKRCKSIRKDGVTVKVCGKKKRTQKKSSSGLSAFAKVLQVGYGSRVWVRGRLVEKSGEGVAGAVIKVGTATTAESPGDRVYKIAGSVKTQKNGVFRYQLPSGGGRHVKAFYEGSPTRRSAESAAITLYVQSRVGFRLNPKRLVNGRRVTMSGRVYYQGDQALKRGKIVELQFRNRNGKKSRWQTFRTIRTKGRRGYFKATHKFKFIASAQRIKFRVKVPAEAGWSYSTATSRARSVVVLPGR